ncbi:unnamed protein product [Lasius platythorax]|uniref:Uncharacterized protein n=1 Tax=Lasius platythorax TaxID=488582 RepID=A0AAV2NCE1_9HYME
MARRCLSEWNGTPTTDFVLSASGTAMACHASYRILITRVTRTTVRLLILYRRGAPYRRPLTPGFTAPGGRPRSIMAVENGPSIDSCTARLPARRGWMASLREKALADRFGARRKFGAAQ